MGSIIEVNLENGMNSYLDKSKVGNRPVVIQDLENLLGVLETKTGPATITTITSKLFSDINWFVSVATDQKQYFLYSPSDGKIYVSDGTDPYFDTLTELVDIDDTKKPTRVDITNWGNEVRFACGYLEEPKVYQVIQNRTFLNNSFSFTGARLDTKSFPRKPSTWIYYDHDTDGVSGELQSGGSITEGKSCFYKIIPIFDGLQEMNLDDPFYGPIVTTAGNQSVKLELDVDSADWNPRITGCRIYRSTTDGTVPDKTQYRNIRTIDFIKETPASWITSTSAYKGRKIYAHSLSADYSTFPATGKWGEAQNTYPSASTIGTEGTFTKASDKFLFLGEDRESTDQWGDSLTTYLWGASASGVTSATISGTGSNGNTQTTRTDTITKLAGCNQIRIGMNAVVYISNWISSASTQTASGSFKILRDVDSDGVYETTFYSSDADFAYISVAFPDGTHPNTAYENVDISSLSDTEVFQIEWSIQGTGGGTASTISKWSSLQFAEFFVDSHTTAYSHQSMLAIADSGIADNSAVGKTLQVGGSDYFIDVNQGDIFRMSGNAGWIDGTSTSGNTVSGGDLVFSNPSGTTYRMTFVDVGEVEGSYHPFSGVNSLDTRFKYSTALNGRQFVANVTIYDGMSATGEEHNDMVIFSELNAPDVLPISNFIQIKDLQGGQIYGIEGLFADIVVFSERGIFRLNVPSDDPTAWSLVESEPNIGCTHPDSIAKWEGGVFFRGTDNLYYITSNFEFIPVGNDIKDKWDTNLVRCKVDVANNRLVVNDTVDDMSYILDLDKFKKGETYWYQFTTDDTTADGDLVQFVDRDGTYKYLLKNGSDTDVKTPSGGSAITSQSFQTGLIDLTSQTMQKGVIIRRIFINSGVVHSGNVEFFLYSSNGAIARFSKTIASSDWESMGDDLFTCSFRVGERFKAVRIFITGILRLERIQIEVD